MKYSESFMVSGNCERSKRAYARYQQMYLTYLAKFNLDPLVEDSLQTFMIVLHHKYSGSTLWTCYSCINAWYKATHKINLKQWPNVTSLMKTITSNHVIKKAPTFSDEDMNKIFERLRQEATAKGYPGNRARLRLIGIAIAYFGLCRGQDLMNLRKKDIVHGDTGKYSVVYKPGVDPNAFIGGGNLAVKKKEAHS